MREYEVDRGWKRIADSCGKTVAVGAIRIEAEQWHHKKLPYFSMPAPKIHNDARAVRGRGTEWLEG